MSLVVGIGNYSSDQISFLAGRIFERYYSKL